MESCLKDLALSWFGGEFDVALLDLYRGEVASQIEDAAHLMNALDFTHALRDIRATIKHLRDKEGATKARHTTRTPQRRRRRTQRQSQRQSGKQNSARKSDTR